MKFGALIKARRNQLDMTLEEVADAAGISKSHLHGLEAEAHSNVCLYTCARLSVALGLPVSLMAAAVLQSNARSPAVRDGGEG